ncbi:GNAT family N-acetyltransferase [Nostoc sp. TCL26-01]|uniref:GNAT family N-acetyltransferase n=1 Tax=Nostoc sp. TCL26-01 TaxID=2576904 RepID=UPI0015B8ED47|nr:N-acetyltransferase [Nostoc sp. TCL26-01]QLE54406.1 N-acetyltransferase [Nostoc sp. TCL26-01]
MNIRCENSSDYLAIATINQLAFGRDNEAQLIAAIRMSEFSIPELALVAEVDHVVVGHILFSYINLVDEVTFKVISLAPIAVHPDFQKQGIGTQLVQAGLAKLATRKEVMVIVLGDPQFYTRFGFEPSVKYDIASPFPVPEDVFMVKPLPGYQAKYRGNVIYPPAFNQV